MITLRELGPHGLRDRIHEQDRLEMEQVGGMSSTDLPGMRSPSALGVGGARTRKQDMAARVMIDHEQHGSLLVSEIWRKYNTDDGRRQVAKHVDVTRNVLARTANALSVAYKRPPIRTFEKGTRKLERAWRSAVMDSARYNLLAEQWARYAWICNVVHVIPQVHEGELVFDEVLPHAADVVFGPGERKPSILVYLSDGPAWVRVAVDNERYWYLDENWNVVAEFAHGYRDLKGRPMQPWIPWRVRARLGSMDYWLRGVGRQLVDTTLKVGVVNAAMGAKRQAGDSKQPVLTARNIDQDVPASQQLGGEHPILLRGGELTAIDLINPVREWIEQMDADIEALAESYGVTRGAVDRSKSADAWQEHVQISEHRESQIPSLLAADRQTSIKASIIMRADGHPDAGPIDPRKVAEKLRIVFQGHTFHERPADRMDFYEKERSAGLASHVDQRMREHPSEDREQARAAVKATIEERNEFAELLAARNLSADAGQDSDNLAQLQGRLGGMTRTPNPDGNDERRDQPEQ
jgi:hypothetical protein